MNQKLDFIQALRGIAALLIVLFHCYTALPDYHGEISNMFFVSNMMGIDLFFIISGFIMVYTTQDCNGTFGYSKRFFIKRFLKIWPVYFFLTMLTGFHKFNIQSIEEVLKSLCFHPLSYEVAPTFGYAALNVGWTLNYEMYFYLVFALGLYFGSRRLLALILIFIFTLVIIPYFFAGHVSMDPYVNYNFKGYLSIATNPLIYDFIAGAIIGKIYLSSWRIDNIAVLNFWLLTSVGIVLWQYFSQYNAGLGILHWGLSLSFMMLALSFYNKKTQLNPPSILTKIGNISFSLYLVHPLVLHLLHHWTTIHYDNGLQAFICIILLVVPISIGAAYISYYFLEQKLVNYLKMKPLLDKA